MEASSADLRPIVEGAWAGLSRVGRRPLPFFAGILVVLGIPMLLMPANGAPGATITAGDSKAHCITLGFPDGVLSQSMITAVGDLTGVTYNCLSVFGDPTSTWGAWETPWMFSTPSDGWNAWLAESPTHQVVVGMDLIPQSVSDNNDPLTWEQPCASGNYDQYATALAKNLVSYGAGNIVIRLGVEANGNWEDDYVGSTAPEMNAWATCYDNEVAAMRAVSGAHFLFVWNPNVCSFDLPLSEWYPGNSYAVANGKPLSFPEWGLLTGMPDDPTYVTDMGQMFNDENFSFESYFDNRTDGVAPLGSAIPNATIAYVLAFG